MNTGPNLFGNTKSTVNYIEYIVAADDFCLACDEVAKARHRCYFQAAALVFLKALYLKVLMIG